MCSLREFVEVSCFFEASPQVGAFRVNYKTAMIYIWLLLEQMLDLTSCMPYTTGLSGCRFWAVFICFLNDKLVLGFRLCATVKIYSDLSPSKTFKSALQLSNLFPCYPRLLEPWISSELSFLDSELILCLFDFIIDIFVVPIPDVKLLSNSPFFNIRSSIEPCTNPI